MTKYRIIRNGLDQYFVEKKIKTTFESAWEIMNAAYVHKTAEYEEKWVRCAYKPTVEEAFQPAAVSRYPAHLHYLTEERAKEALREMKGVEEYEKLKGKVEVVYEE